MAYPRLGAATLNSNGSPVRFYRLTDTFVFAPGLNITVVNGTTWSVQNGAAWLPLNLPRVVVTETNAAVALLLAPAAFNAAYTVTQEQDIDPNNSG